MLKLMYKELVIGTVVANHSMSIDDALELLKIDMDKFARKNDFDDWDFDDLHLENIEFFKITVFDANSSVALGEFLKLFEAKNEQEATAKAYSYLAFERNVSKDILDNIYCVANIMK